MRSGRVKRARARPRESPNSPSRLCRLARRRPRAAAATSSSRSPVTPRSRSRAGPTAARGILQTESLSLEKVQSLRETRLSSRETLSLSLSLSLDICAKRALSPLRVRDMLEDALCLLLSRVSPLWRLSKVPFFLSLSPKPARSPSELAFRRESVPASRARSPEQLSRIDDSRGCPRTSSDTTRSSRLTRDDDRSFFTIRGHARVFRLFQNQNVRGHSPQEHHNIFSKSSTPLACGWKSFAKLNVNLWGARTR